MVYTPLVRKAMCLAYEAHHGQLDKSGIPYLYHPIHLAEQMTTEAAVVTALLHDVLEDTALTLEQLEAEGMPADILEALTVLTRQPDEEYETYIRRVCGNPLAKVVKRADLLHNSDETRQPCCSPQWAAVHRERYRRALEILNETPDSSGEMEEL